MQKKKIMKKTGDIVIDTVLKNAAAIARDLIRAGHGADVETCLEKAILTSRREYRWDDSRFREKAIRKKIALNEEDVRKRCWKIILDAQKRYRLLDIRKASIEVTLKDFAEISGLPLEYTLRNNSTVSFSVKIPSTGQRLRFSASFSKVLSDGWRESTEKDIRELFAISGRLGRLRLSSAND